MEKRLSDRDCVHAVSCSGKMLEQSCDHSQVSVLTKVKGVHYV